MQNILCWFYLFKIFKKLLLPRSFQYNLWCETIYFWSFKEMNLRKSRRQSLIMNNYEKASHLLNVKQLLELQLNSDFLWWLFLHERKNKEVWSKSENANGFHYVLPHLFAWEKYCLLVLVNICWTLGLGRKGPIK